MSEAPTDREAVLDPDRLISVAPPAVAATNEWDTVVHNLQTGASYRLNDIGTRIWQLIETGATVSTITATIRAEYALPDDLSSEQVLRDVLTVVSNLRSYGLVDIAV